jgi:hypothetical protein
LEFCIQCGKEVEQLNPTTGWCITCSPDQCLNCGEKLKSSSVYCNKCKKLFWLEAHADELEELMGTGLSFTSSIQRIRNENRPVCLCCELPIPHARSSDKRPTKFCQRTAQCKSARRRYRTLQEGKLSLPASIALEQVLRELGKQI